jgi:hypothetical protein
MSISSGGPSVADVFLGGFYAKTQKMEKSLLVAGERYVWSTAAGCGQSGSVEDVCGGI